MRHYLVERWVVIDWYSDKGFLRPNVIDVCPSRTAARNILRDLKKRGAVHQLACVRLAEIKF
jgi:hypothetical protein